MKRPKQLPDEAYYVSQSNDDDNDYGDDDDNDDDKDNTDNSLANTV